MSISQNDMKIFGNLFVLEAANNHCGDIERGFEKILYMHLNDNIKIIKSVSQNSLRNFCPII